MPSGLVRSVSAMAGALVVTAVTVAAILRPEPVTAAFALAVLAAAILARPTQIGFPLAVALLYSNVAVVAVRFWGLPAVFPLIVPAVMAPALAMRLLLGGRALRFDRGFFLLTCFVGANVFSAVFAQFPGTSQDVLFQLLTEGLLIYFLITNLTTSRNILIAVVWAVVLAAAFGAGLAVLQQLTSTRLVDFGGLALRVPDYPSPNAPLRAQGPLSEANFFAQTLVMAMPLAVGLALVARRRLTKFAALAAFVVTVAGVALTGSRGGAIAAAAVLLMLPLIPGVRVRLLAVSATLMVAVVLLAVPGYLNRLTSLAQVEAVASGSPDVDVSIQGRVVENLIAVQMFVDHPIVGVGPGNYPVLYRAYAADYLGFQSRGSRPPHSLPLQLLAEVGVIGMATFGAVIGFLLLALWRARQVAQRPEAVIAMACFVALGGYLVSGLFLHPAYLRFLWLVLGVAGSAIAVARLSSAGPAPLRQSPAGSVDIGRAASNEAVRPRSR